MLPGTTISEPKLICVASTSQGVEVRDVDNGISSRRRQTSGSSHSHFRNARFTADGTTIVTQSEDQCLQTWILPQDLLHDEVQPHRLSPQATLKSPSPIQSHALYPGFELSDASTTVVLTASKDVPISLSNLLHEGTVHATYPLINPTNEQFTAPTSLEWSRDGSRFGAGSKDQISIYDSSRSGSGPLLQHKTASGKAERKLLGGASLHSCKGIISALRIGANGLLAAGSTERQIGIFSDEGSGACVTSFSVAPTDGSHGLYSGSGIMNVEWSPCGKYLFVAERQSDGIHVYDMRNTLRRVSWLSSRKANTTQRMDIDVVATADGSEVWAGGTDGRVRMWNSPGSVEGEHAPDQVVNLHQGEFASCL